MSNQTVQTLKGFRDFLPAEKRKRDYVAAKIKATFELYGFEPLETPTLEYASLLLGKYGAEADKLVYTFQDRGDRMVGLRYDQTVPTARVLAQYQNELPKYFRRYQIQNVFRADKPQQGRYREFTQCDCDVLGSTSPIADAELLAVYYAVYKNLGLTSIEIQVNNRQDIKNLLNAFDTFPMSAEDSNSFLQSMDKLDKVSEAEVIEELVTIKKFPRDQVVALIENLKERATSDNMSTELKEIIEVAVQLGVPRTAIKYNPFMVRGLDYYTGLIFEGRIPEYTVGSVGGGGRYDNLINDLAGIDMPAVGFGIGFDRTVEAADQQGLVPTAGTGTQVMVTIFDETFVETSALIAQRLRQAGVTTELYPSVDKLAKQFKVANQKQITFVIVVGADEQAADKVQLKNMSSGEQELVSLEEAVVKLKKSSSN